MAKRPWNFKRRGSKRGPQEGQKQKERKGRPQPAEIATAPVAPIPITFRFRPRNEPQSQAWGLFAGVDILIMPGPAGAGKTVVAMALAAREVLDGYADHITLIRPAVEAGNQRLGFLPGEVDDKLGPHYAAFFEALGCVVPLKGPGKFPAENLKPQALAYLRGRTFRHEIVVLDEAQNCTRAELLLVLSRVGEGAKLIVLGDPEQSDLPAGKGGLPWFVERLEGAAGVGVVRFLDEHVVRHPRMSGWLKRLRA